MANGGWWSEQKDPAATVDSADRGPMTLEQALAHLNEALPHTVGFTVHRSEWTQAAMEFDDYPGVRPEPPRYIGGVEWSVTVVFPASQVPKYLEVTSEPSLSAAVEGAIARYDQWIAARFADASTEEQKPQRLAAPGAAERGKQRQDRKREGA
jgi:hypothetical protein